MTFSAAPMSPLAQSPRSPLTLYLASSNPGKLREFRQAASGLHLAVEQVPGIGGFPACVEDGATFEANARKKALHYAALANALVFADDSGLCVDALGGAPGVYSARFSGSEATDEANNQKLLRELGHIAGGTAVAQPGAPEWNSPAHYVCVIALAEPGNCLTVAEGRVDGAIISSPRGDGGFGYDPYFFYPPFAKTFAEISSDAKFAVSHRGIAFRKLLEYFSSRGR